MSTPLLTRATVWGTAGVLRLSGMVVATALVLGCVELRPRGERGDGGVVGCDVPGECRCTPQVTEVGLGVLAHGARLTVTGGCFSDATEVLIGGVAQTFVVDDDGSITVPAVADNTPVGLSQPLVVASAEGESEPHDTTVAHLVVNEVDARTDMGGMQKKQFIEIDTGLDASVDLSDYMVVLFRGNDDGVFDMTRGAVLGDTSASGFYLLANSMVEGEQATLPNNALATMMDAQAVVVFQGSVLPSPNATLAGITLPMVDAVVFSSEATANDAGLLDLCYPSVADRVQVDEESNGGDALAQSVRRCGTERRAGTSFGAGASTPGASNGCP